MRIGVTLVGVALEKAYRLFVARRKANAGQCNKRKPYCQCQQKATHQPFLQVAWVG